MQILLIQVAILLATAPLTKALVTSVREGRFATIVDDIKASYVTTWTGLFLRERGSWVVNAGPNVAIAIAVLVAAALPTLATSTPLSGYLDLVMFGTIVTLLCVIGQALRSESHHHYNPLHAVMVGVALVLGAVSLMALGYQADLASLVRIDMPLSAWLIAPVATYLLIAAELMRPPSGMSQASAVFLGLAKTVVASSIGVMIARVAFPLPVATANATPTELAASVVVLLLIVAGVAVLLGGVGRLLLRFRVDGSHDRQLIFMTAACIAVITSIIANFV